MVKSSSSTGAFSCSLPKCNLKFNSERGLNGHKKQCEKNTEDYRAFLENTDTVLAKSDEDKKAYTKQQKYLWRTQPHIMAKSNERARNKYAENKEEHNEAYVQRMQRTKQKDAERSKKEKEVREKLLKGDKALSPTDKKIAERIKRKRKCMSNITEQTDEMIRKRAEKYAENSLDGNSVEYYEIKIRKISDQGMVNSQFYEACRKLDDKDMQNRRAREVSPRRRVQKKLLRLAHPERQKKYLQTYRDKHPKTAEQKQEAANRSKQYRDIHGDSRRRPEFSKAQTRSMELESYIRRQNRKIRKNEDNIDSEEQHDRNKPSDPLFEHEDFQCPPRDFIFRACTQPCLLCGENQHNGTIARIDTFGAFTLNNICFVCSICAQMKYLVGMQEFIHQCYAITYNDYETVDVPFKYYKQVQLNIDMFNKQVQTKINRSAAQKQLSNTVTDSEIENLIMQNIQCHYCGSLFTKDNKRGVDRVDNARGYDIDNIVMCCTTCNFMKRSMNRDKFIDKCAQISYHCTQDGPINVKESTDMALQTVIQQSRNSLCIV